MDVHPHTTTPPGLASTYHHQHHHHNYHDDTYTPTSALLHHHLQSCAQQSAHLGGGPFGGLVGPQPHPQYDMNTMATSLATPPAFTPTGLSADHAPAATTSPTMSVPMTRSRKRKAESQENERLSKRLSLLNLEKNGQKLYVPVESPHLKPTTEEDQHALPSIPEDDTMRLDDSAHKVYIYNLDDELSSSDTESTCSDDSNHRLIFLSDIDKHLRQNRIPPSVFANPEGELAGSNINDMQMVLYRDPSSLTVSAEHDSVRRAVIEARNRMRQRQKEERGSDGAASAVETTASSSSSGGSRSSPAILRPPPALTPPSISGSLSAPSSTRTIPTPVQQAAGFSAQPPDTDEMELD